MRERAAFDILSGQPDGKFFAKQGAEGERFRHCPVDALAGLHRFAAPVEQSLHRLVRGKVVRDGRDAPTDFAQDFWSNARIAATRLVIFCTKTRPPTIKPVGLIGLVTIRHCQFGVEMRAILRLHLVDLGCGKRPFRDQTVGVDGNRRRMCLDLLVHLRPA